MNTTPINDRFADVEIHSLIFELDHKYFFECTVNIGGARYVSWWDIKRWLWEKHRLWFNQTTIVAPTDILKHKFYDIVYRCKEGFPTLFRTDMFDSPAESEIEGIKKAVKYLHEQKQKGK